jgi:HK97 family phage portal protein
LGFLDSVLRRNSELESLFDLDVFDDVDKRKYLKIIAMETCLNFIGRTISQSEFRMMQDNKRLRDDWDYLLNVRPNTDQSAAEFWQATIHRLISKNEVLIILSDQNELLLADSYDRVEYALFPDIFKGVTVKDYTFKRSFNMDEVIFLTYNNAKLTSYMDGAFEDYTLLYSRMMETQKLNNQVRGIVEVDSTQSLDENRQNKLQEFIDKLFRSFRNNVIALVPKLKGFGYTEVNKGDNNGKSFDEVTKVKRDAINDVANILGIPTSLIHGEMSDYETAIKAYIKFCISPLIKKIRDELNAKLISRSEYMKGRRIDIRGIAEINPLELASSVDKLRASGVYNGNEIRIKLGDEPVDNPALDEYVLTKNYQSAAESAEEGGEGENA